jgi:hypothetical protein
MSKKSQALEGWSGETSRRTSSRQQSAWKQLDSKSTVSVIRSTKLGDLLKLTLMILRVAGSAEIPDNMVHVVAGSHLVLGEYGNSGWSLLEILATG